MYIMNEVFLPLVCIMLVPFERAKILLLYAHIAQGREEGEAMRIMKRNLMTW